MKRIILAVAVSSVLVILYLILASIVFVAIGQNLDYVGYVDLPMRLPKLIFYYFSPPTAQDYSKEFSQRKVVLGLISFLVNILLYSIPIYSLLNIFRKPRINKIEITEPPPPPPKFK